MNRKKFTIAIFTTGVLLVVGMVFLMTAAPARAQCGSQASSCKNCHETQGKDPVNNDGTAWHTQHAFGDFCYLCHGGNNQATDETTAHTGMVDPLADINTSCKGCHPTDTLSLAQSYAATLGIQVGTSTAPTGAATSQPATTPAAGETTVVSTAAPAAAIPPADMVDYSQRYNEIVLGKTPVNWGNVILLVVIGMLVVGGGGFVIANEKLVKVSFGETKKVEGEYPNELVDMLPSIAALKPQARKTLKNILSNPKKSEQVLGLIDAVVSDNKPKE